MSYYFSPSQGDPIYNGHHVLADTGSVYNGNIVSFTAGGTSGSISLSTGSGAGIAYDLLAMTELPTTQELVANIGGDYCNYLSGYFEALVGSDLFSGSALPAVNAKLYDNADGYISATAGGHSTIGRCIGHVTIQHKDGAYSVARCVFDFTQIL